MLAPLLPSLPIRSRTVVLSPQPHCSIRRFLVRQCCDSSLSLVPLKSFTFCFKAWFCSWGTYCYFHGYYEVLRLHQIFCTFKDFLRPLLYVKHICPWHGLHCDFCLTNQNIKRNKKLSCQKSCKPLCFRDLDIEILKASSATLVNPLTGPDHFKTVDVKPDSYLITLKP